MPLALGILDREETLGTRASPPVDWNQRLFHQVMFRHNTLDNSDTPQSDDKTMGSDPSDFPLVENLYR